MSLNALVAGAGVLSSTVAMAVHAAPLQPTGKWIVHFDDAQCVAERSYGPPGQPLYLTLKQPALGEVMQLDILEPGFTNAPTQIDGRIRFEDQDAVKTSVLRYQVPKEKVRVHMMNVPLKQFAAARTASTLQITAAALDKTLALSQLGPLLDLMDQCVADLRRVWNIRLGEDEKGTVRQDVKGDLRRLFSSEDYPYEALMNMDSGSVKVALLVNEQGKVADCSVIETSGVAILDVQSCAILKSRAKFAPAIGPDGAPAKDAFIQLINWQVL
jgi:TonB family protein